MKIKIQIDLDKLIELEEFNDPVVVPCTGILDVSVVVVVVVLIVVVVVVVSFNAFKNGFIVPSACGFESHFISSSLQSNG